MKKILSLVAAVLLASAPCLYAQDDASESLVGQTYTGKTTPLPSSAVWQNANTAPGVYSQLAGSYSVSLAAAYYQISNFVDWDKGKTLVVNENNTIVYESDLQLTAAGGRYFNAFILNIPEEDAITTPGTYRIIFPTSSGWDVTNDAYITPRQSEKIYNLEAGPYIIGELKDPVPADVTVTPQGTFDPDNSPEFVSISVANADIFNVTDIDAVISVTGPGGKVTMEDGVKDGNELKWEFPYDATTNRAAILADGTYTITITWAQLSGYTADLNPLEFPSQTSYTFTMEGGMAKVTPDVTITPNAGKYKIWTSNSILIKFNDYKLNCTTAELKEIELSVLKPNGEVVTVTSPGRSSVIQLAFQPTFIDEDGTYKCTLKLEGMTGTNQKDATEIVKLENVSFEYVIGNPAVEATYSYTPAADASFYTDEAPDVVLTITNAATLEVAADAPQLITVIAENEAQDQVTMSAPTVSDNTITWKFPADLAPGKYSIVINLGEGVSGTTAEGAPLKFENIEYVVEALAPIVYESVDPKCTFDPKAGHYNTWTKTSIACTWNADYKLTRDTRAEILNAGRFITIQKPDGTVEKTELTQTSATTKEGLAGANFVKMSMGVNVSTFSIPGKYIVTFPLKGVKGVMAADATKFIEFDQDAVVEYDVYVPAVLDITPNSIEPAADSEMTEISTVTVTFAEPTDYNDVPAQLMSKLQATAATAVGVANEDKTVYTFTFDPAISEPGVYQFSLPEGAFSDEDYAKYDGLTGHGSPEISANYTVVLPPAVYDLLPAVVTPAAGEVEEISSITLTFDATTYYPNSAGAPVGLLMSKYTRSTVQVTAVDNDFLNPTAYTFTFDPAITTPDHYQFVIAEGAFCDGAFDESDGATGHASPELTYAFEIAIPPVAYDLVPASVVPADGTEMREIKHVTLTFDEVALADLNALPEGKLYLLDGDSETLVATATCDEGDDYLQPKQYVFTLSQPVTTEGIYKFVVAEGAFFNETYDTYEGESGSVNPELEYTFVVDLNWYDIVPVSTEPANKAEVGELSTFTLVFNTPVFAEDFHPIATLYSVEDGNATEVEEMVGEPNDKFFPTEYTFTLKKAVSAEGSYELVVERNEFYYINENDNPTHEGVIMGRHANPVLTYTFTVKDTTGILDIVGEDGLITVYNLAGVKVLEAAPAVEFNNLRPGFYIVNGNKVYKK